MGLLALGTPLPWSEAKQHADYVREHGIEQLLHIWHNLKDRTGDRLLWGDEVSPPTSFLSWILSGSDEASEDRGRREGEALWDWVSVGSMCRRLRECIASAETHRARGAEPWRLTVPACILHVNPLALLFHHSPLRTVSRADRVHRHLVRRRAQERAPLAPPDGNLARPPSRRGRTQADSESGGVARRREWQR